MFKKGLKLRLRLCIHSNTIVLTSVLTQYQLTAIKRANIDLVPLLVHLGERKAENLWRGYTWRRYLGWVTQLSLSRLKQSEISILIYLRSVFFLIFLGDFWVYLGINSLSERISENYAKREFWSFAVVLKLEFDRTDQTVTHQPSSNLVGVQLSGGVPNPFFFV